MITLLAALCLLQLPAERVDDDVRAATALLDMHRDPERFTALRASLAARDADVAARPDDVRRGLQMIEPDGLRALVLEADAARAQVLAWPRARLLRANVDVASGSALVFGGLEALLALGVGAFAARRAPAAQRRVRAAVATLIPWSAWRSALAPSLAVLARGVVEAVAVVAVVFTFTTALAGAPPELLFFGPVALNATLSRVIVLGVVGFASSSVVSGAAGLSAPARRGLSRLCVGVLFATVMAMAAVDLAHALVGDGALAALVARVGVVGVVGAGLWRLRRLDDVIARAVRARAGESRLHRALARERPSLLAVGVGAGVIGVGALGDVVRSVLGRSGSASRLLAWAFRRRLQQLERTSSLTPLPPEVRAALDVRLSLDERPAQQRRRLVAVRSRIEVLRERGVGFSAALVGLPGSGRSSALAALVDGRGELPLVRGRPAHRLCSEREACVFLSDLLGLAGVDDDNALVAALRTLPPRLIVIDDAHRFLLRAPGSLDGHRALVDVVGRTSDRHGWLLAFHEPAFVFAGAVYGARNEFQDVVMLGPWSADETTALLDGRLQKAGLTARFDDLIAHDELGGADLVRTGESFFHLVWDSADGNPRAALSLLGQSLVVNEKEPGICRVRPFHTREASELEDAQDITRLVLAALELHHSATPTELGQVLRVPAHICESSLVFLRARGVVVLDDDGVTARINPVWHIAARRFLAQKNLTFH
ncbi:MAG: hypothetical protein Q8O67_05775 [Deltaproteobacteria bacterium]|nr:hypothetical protein [Deltaproteobacteria bacterium]